MPGKEQLVVEGLGYLFNHQDIQPDCLGHPDDLLYLLRLVLVRFGGRLEVGEGRGRSEEMGEYAYLEVDEEDGGVIPAEKGLHE